jgi:hypothetical protein
LPEFATRLRRESYYFSAKCDWTVENEYLHLTQKGNGSDTPLRFDMASDYTVDAAGARSVVFKT